jgi:SAM-dependent methyltransferase
MSTASDPYWRDYYAGVHRDSREWLDYSNAAVQQQSLALALEAAGAVVGRSCLDVGCGKGQFALMLSALGAAEVTAMELVPDTVARLGRDHPGIRWIAGDAGAQASYADVAACDLVSALEVLQYVPFGSTVELLWSRVKEGGRLIGLIPNRDCPIVAKPMERFGGRFMAKDAAGIAAILGGLPQLECWRLRGMSFAEDQRFAPYAVSPWTDATAWPRQPNRFLFVAKRAGGQPPAASG